MKDQWKVQIHGKRGDKTFEIAVINTEFASDPQRQFGWFDENKLLICHSGGPLEVALEPAVWEHQIRVAESIARDLNCISP